MYFSLPHGSVTVTLFLDINILIDKSLDFPLMIGCVLGGGGGGHGDTKIHYTSAAL